MPFTVNHPEFGAYYSRVVEAYASGHVDAIWQALHDLIGPFHAAEPIDPSLSLPEEGVLNVGEAERPSNVDPDGYEYAAVIDPDAEEE